MKMKNTARRNLAMGNKALPRGVFIALDAYVRREGQSRLDDLRARKKTSKTNPRPRRKDGNDGAQTRRRRARRDGADLREGRPVVEIKMWINLYRDRHRTRRGHRSPALGANTGTSPRTSRPARGRCGTGHVTPGLIT